MKIFALNKERSFMMNINSLCVVLWMMLPLCCLAAYPALAQTGSSYAANDSFVYHVGISDVLNIRVYDQADLTGDFCVSHQGDIVYPLLGQLKVAGLAPSEIRAVIKELLEKDYLHNPVVSVTVKEYKSKEVTILGTVQKPGPYYLARPIRLFDLLLKAGGLEHHLHKIQKGYKIRVMRHEKNSKLAGAITTIYIDLYELIAEGKNEANIYLYDGDVVYVYVPRLRDVYFS